MEQAPLPDNKRILKIIGIVAAISVLLFCACPVLSAFFLPFFG